MYYVGTRTIDSPGLPVRRSGVLLDTSRENPTPGAQFQLSGFIRYFTTFIFVRRGKREARIDEPKPRIG